MHTVHKPSGPGDNCPCNDIIDENGRKVGEIANTVPEPPIDIPFPEDEFAEGHFLIPREGDDSPIFICGRCDMVVGENDRACEFCGAEFEETDCAVKEEKPGLPISITDPEEDDQSGPSIQRYKDMRASPFYPCSAEKVDVLGMMEECRARLVTERFGGTGSSVFLSYAKMLRGIEEVMTEAGDLGAETEEARRALLSAWKACHEGKWAYASQLAEESRRALSANVGDIIRGQILCLREAMIEMKRRGRSVTAFVIEIKTIHKALEELRLGDAIRLTKGITAEIKDIQMQILNSMGCEEADSDNGLPFHGHEM